MILVTDPNTLKVAGGKFRLTSGPDDVLVAHPGCGAVVCVQDAELRIGGMIHFLTSGADLVAAASRRPTPCPLQDLFDAIARQGADRRGLRCWLFGGADDPDDGSGLGAAHGAFARGFLEAAGYRLVGCDLGGTAARRVRFHPHSGRVEVISLAPPAPAPSHPA